MYFFIFLAVTSVASGRIGDQIGRKMTLFWGAVVFTIGGVIQTFTTGFYVMVLGRIVAGFGVGLLSCVRSYVCGRGHVTKRMFPAVRLSQFIKVKYLLQTMYVLLRSAC